MKKKKKLTLSRKRAIVGLLFISPWLIGFILFYLRSLIMTIRFGMSVATIEDGGVGYTLTYTGLANFKELFTSHPTFKQVLTSSMLDMVVDIPLIIFFSIFVALLLNKKFKGRTFVRAVFFLPVILNSEAIQQAIALSTQLMGGGIASAPDEIVSATSTGVNIEYYLRLFSDIAIPDAVFLYIIGAVSRLSSIITASGVQIIIFIAALQAVPSSLYEVAKIEGATGYETFWKVTLPMIMPLILTNIVYTVVDNFANSDVVQLSYNTIFMTKNYGLGSLMSLISMIVVCLFLIIVCGTISKKTFYYN
ncbi:carbohydrate ABC transporter permease [Lachnoclostridium phytofermentans]|uniref:Binding-protein-dependent transport systems inner membrane component n=1 Tax=Lachnoclostridium phytofermentans (strain ATCC 700394 / DSM 18823 / ISDg) TaxID=357809 RepID=A9KK59_LACP7|nr:sugar ABC transporter permease [Lachnoclostridium phytofermentans]ABX42631.1 binding-protein-dependent transport systems inner membrane component [Lachnoclostridium phytofermentans ISDg]